MSKRVVPPASSSPASGSGSSKKKSAQRAPVKKAAKKKAVKSKVATRKSVAAKKPAGKIKRQKSTAQKSTVKTNARATGAGLVAKPKKVTIKRPSRPSARQNPVARTPIDVRVDFDPLEINSHRKLVSNYGAIVQRINEQPELSVLLLINPVLALKELNIKVSKPISNHILHAMQH
ncbi:MAG: hypothetical protein GY927_19045, partial [bacterium]|nr:hypothetical protein [bacterium]